jgi:uncharacterized protein (DUF1800 family)
MDKPLRALNRFGLGARPGEAERLPDPRGWLRAQLEGPPQGQAPQLAAPEAIAEGLRAVDEARARGPAELQQARRRLLEIAQADARAALAGRIASDRPFVERLVAFWSNHLCVSTAAAIPVAALAGSYERDAIRPHVLGRFEDMVLASATHPAMLIYLDNFRSVGPGSPGVRARGNARRGLNENHARELLELHTLGVDGGYTQQDVSELAKILTGWTVEGLPDPGRVPADRLPQVRGGRGRGSLAPRAAPADGLVRFAFRPILHEPGPKTVLGVRYAAGDVRDGERVIRDLCRHPSTARFVAAKLVTHFVSDEPPSTAVDRIARVFRDTAGDLRAVAAALVDLPEAWEATMRKFRAPQDWLVAACRACGAGPAPELVLALRQLRHPLWSPPSPKGFGDRTSEWADPDSLLNRAELARTVARRLAGQARLDPRRLLEVVDVPNGDPLRTLLADTSIQPAERIALALAGPAFQWR